jgi:CheY-like chemotaxis protein
MKTLTRPRTARRKKTILVVEGERPMGGSIRETLGNDYRVRLSGSGEEALKLIARLPRLDAALVDVRLPGMSGLEFGRRLREARPEVKVFLMTNGTAEAAGEAFAIRAEGCLPKPVAMETLRDMLLSHVGISAP